MAFNLSQDIRSVTDLKRRTRDILDQIHATGRPVVLTVNGKADAVLMDASAFERHLSAANLSRLLLPAEQDVLSGRTRPMGNFVSEFKRGHKVPR